MQSNTAAVENQPVNFPNFSVENREGDPFTTRDGRFVGHDGFVVPKNFDEFHERFPHHIPNWVKRHADRFAPKEDLEDWTQDLIVHMKYLPTTSKHRDAGKEDIVQTFDPSKHYGANQPRFLNYINLCLANKFRTMQSARMKNPLCRAGNVPLSAQTDGEDRSQADDEYCHSHSEHLRRAVVRLEKQRQDKHLLAEFADFVRREDSRMLPAMGAILAAGNSSRAAALLGLPAARFDLMRIRLRRLGKCFVIGEQVPRQRRPYKRRVKIKAISSPRDCHVTD